VTDFDFSCHADSATSASRDAYHGSSTIFLIVKYARGETVRVDLG
jgi:hypothetical protein